MMMVFTRRCPIGRSSSSNSNNNYNNEKNNVAHTVFRLYI